MIETRENLQEKIAQARRVMRNVADPLLTTDLRNFIADLENRLRSLES
jgi:hypothetical protein